MVKSALYFVIVYFLRFWGNTLSLPHVNPSWTHFFCVHAMKERHFNTHKLGLGRILNSLHKCFFFLLLLTHVRVTNQNIWFHANPKEKRYWSRYPPRNSAMDVFEKACRLLVLALVLPGTYSQVSQTPMIICPDLPQRRRRACRTRQMVAFLRGF